MVKLIRQRYILFEIFSEAMNEMINEKNIINTLWRQISTLFGLKISFTSGLWLIKWDPNHNIGIIRCDHLTKEHVIASMAMITHIKQMPVIFHTRYTSGTIKKTLKIWKESYGNASLSDLKKLYNVIASKK